ncbi:hypothetical protein COO60DRAFT_619640 [Scenedesmus sp. NREL 46B-D3]|nr:hypothetical protein COO60DRAFT_619640 [Scenedesmus sp. NREL 46B-D3]
MRSNQKFIEFWDVRHAAAALRAMNRAELSRLPAAGPSLSTAPAAAGGSSSGLAGMAGHEQDAAGGVRSKGLSGDGSGARAGDAGASSSSHAYAAAQVAAAMQQLEMEQQQQQQQQQQQPFQRSQGQPIPRTPSHDAQMVMAMQHADVMQQQVAQRGMVRPVSGMLDRMHSAVSPPLSLGPLSQSWDTSGNPGSLAGVLNRQQQQHQQSGQQQLGHQHGHQQQQQQQSLLQQQQQQQQLLLQQLASGLLRGSRTDLSGLDPVIETEQADALQKLLMGSSSGAAAAAAAAAGAAGAASPRPAAPSGNTGLHVSDSASSIASTQGSVFGAGMGTGVLPGGAHAAGVHSIHHGPFGPQVSGMPGPSGTQAFGNQQAMAPGAAANSRNLHRSFGSSDQLHSMEQLMQQQAAAGVAHDEQGSAAGLGALGSSMSSNNLAAVAAAAGLSANAAASLGLASGLGNSIANASFDSGLNLMQTSIIRQGGWEGCWAATRTSAMPGMLRQLVACTGGQAALGVAASATPACPCLLLQQWQRSSRLSSSSSSSTATATTECGHSCSCCCWAAAGAAECSCCSCSAAGASSGCGPVQLAGLPAAAAAHGAAAAASGEHACAAAGWCCQPASAAAGGHAPSAAGCSGPAESCQPGWARPSCKQLVRDAAQSGCAAAAEHSSGGSQCSSGGSSRRLRHSARREHGLPDRARRR